MKRRIYWILGLVAVLVAGALIIRRYFFSAKPPPHYETAKVERGRIVARVTATGTLSAHVTVQVGSQVSGRILELRVDFNSPVKKGDLLARIDPQLFQAAVAQARANYAAAQGALAKAKAQAINAKAQYERAQRLSQSGLVAQADLETANAANESGQAEVQAANGELEQATASLHQAEVNLAYTRISSPVDGVVISRNIDVGQTVAATFQAPTLFTIAEDLHEMQVDTSVTEADVGKLRPEMVASFTVDAFPTERFKGKVRQIRNAPQTLQNVVTYDAVIDVENPDLKLRPGMTANVTFVYAEKDNVLKVPNAALRFRPPSDQLGSAASQPSTGPIPTAQAAGAEGPGRRHAQSRENPDLKTVWLPRGSSLQPVTVRIGVSDGTVTEVTDTALHEGDEVVVDMSDAGKPASSAGQPRSVGRLL